MAAMEHETEPAAAGQPEAEPDTPAADSAAQVTDPVAGSRRGQETGEPRVDAALRLLDRLPGLPVSEHPELFEQVHAQLTDVLGELDSGPAAAAGPRAG
jgi:hypothetical protein